MSPSTLSSAFLAVAAISSIALVNAQPDPADPTPLYSKHYAYPSGIVSALCSRSPELGVLNVL